MFFNNESPSAENIDEDVREDIKFTLTVAAHVRSRNRLKPNFLFPEWFSTHVGSSRAEQSGVYSYWHFTKVGGHTPRPGVGSALLGRLVFVSCPRTCDALLQHQSIIFCFFFAGGGKQRAKFSSYAVEFCGDEFCEMKNEDLKKEITWNL